MDNLDHTTPKNLEPMPDVPIPTAKQWAPKKSHKSKNLPIEDITEPITVRYDEPITERITEPKTVKTETPTIAPSTVPVIKTIVTGKNAF